jgi:hypothetical protein
MVENLLQSMSRHEPDPYLQLPECIRQYYARDEWMVLSDSQKTNLIQTETEPEC